MCALNINDAKESLFGGIKAVAKKQQQDVKQPTKNLESNQKIKNPIFSKNEENAQQIQSLRHETELPKSMTFDRVTLRLTPEQRDQLAIIARKTMRARSRFGSNVDERERITSNTILRALIHNFLIRAEELEEASIYNEEDAIKWINQLFKS